MTAGMLGNGGGPGNPKVETAERARRPGKTWQHRSASSRPDRKCPLPVAVQALLRFVSRQDSLDVQGQGSQATSSQPRPNG